jgi:flavodoxin
MKCVIVLFSYHHKNTEKIAVAIADVLGAQIVKPEQVDIVQLQDYDLIAFGSGIYDAKHHVSLFELVEKMPQGAGKKVFLFSTCGVPGIGMNDEYTANNHAPLREKLKAKGYVIIGEFGCIGHNTNSFLKAFGGINKGRPNPEDLKHAEDFARQLQEKMRDKVL